jgi:hypothetical protein
VGKFFGPAAAGAFLTVEQHVEQWGSGMGVTTWRRRTWGAWHGARAAVSAGSSPTAVGAGGCCVRARPALNRGEVGADQWAPLQSREAQGHTVQTVFKFEWFKNIQTFPNFD